MGIPLMKGVEIERLRLAGQAAAGMLAHVGARLAPGITTAEIDQWVREDTALAAMPTSASANITTARLVDSSENNVKVASSDQAMP